jgi:hypothetical protein
VDEGHARRAGRLAAETATFLHALLYAGSDLRRPREELTDETQQDLDDAIRALSEAEDALDPGIGAPDVDAGRARLQIARQKLAAYELNSPFVRAELRNEIRRALGSIDDADRLAAI